MQGCFHSIILEDDTDIAQLISLQVKSLDGSAYLANNIESATTYSNSHAKDLFILDLSLPDGDGLTFCKTIREHDQTTPILIISARSNEVDRVKGLELGADDYLSKPFGLAELKARIKALLRRSKNSDIIKPIQENITLGNLTITPKKHRVCLNDKVITLTVKEFELLTLFALNPNQIFNRNELLNTIWGVDYIGYEHTVNSHLNRLRKKIEVDANTPKIIETIWGIGYRLNSQSLENTSI
ncbi:response regulator transcription factor [Thiomicrorhabdus sp.]|uniref:response regulator transcription factor n=1 Tax=Thiomicrorhabdus sp. TaxID=2039724 RepID=UPI002AA7BDD9|nr:response regulator transcription factor [Thiomicrorhabdus sp.]